MNATARGVTHNALDRIQGSTMVQKDRVLRMIVADDSQNDTERLVSLLRNHGLAVRSTAVANEDDLQEAFAQTHDLFVCTPAMPDLPLENALRLCEQSGKDIPLIVLSDEDDSELRAEVLGMGARDLVSKTDETHFRLVILREMDNLHTRRQVRRLEASLREAERRVGALLDSSRDAIAYVHDGMHIYANTSYLELFGYESFDELEGLPILDLVAGDDQGRLKGFLRDHDKGKHDDDQIEMAINGADPNRATAVLEFSPASWDGETCTQILIREQSSSAELEEQLATLSKQDMVTGLLNRAHFIKELDRAIAAGLDSDDAGQSGLIYIQPDNMDDVRANIGITAVDAALTDIATTIKRHIGARDLAARYGDDTLLVLLEDQGVHEALAIAEAIRAEVAEHVTEYEQTTITTTASFGIALISDAVSTSTQAINTAYEACNVAMEEGGNRVHLHAEKNTDRHGGDAEWRRRLEDALAQDGFRLVYQPIVSLAGDGIERYEVRLRLNDDGGHPLAPADVIAAADRLDLLGAVDEWVITHATRALASAQSGDRALMLFVKISGASLRDEGTVTRIGEAINATGIDGQQLTFELDESVAVTQLNQAKAFYKGIKTLKCGFVLDGFGSGMNSFQTLKHLPADYLKLDHAVTSDLGESDATRETVGTLIGNAHEMRKQVIVGYLEEASVLAALWQFQVDFVQGHFLGEPTEAMDYDFDGMVI